MLKAATRLRWVLFGSYAVLGLVALMAATPMGLEMLGLSVDRLSFLPARITGLPWSLSTWLAGGDPVVILALLGVAYALNLAIAWVFANAAGENAG